MFRVQVWLLVVVFSLQIIFLPTSLAKDNTGKNNAKIISSCEDIVDDELLVKFRSKPSKLQSINSSAKFIPIFKEENSASKTLATEKLKTIYAARKTRTHNLKEKYKTANFYTVKFKNLSCEDLHQELKKLKTNPNVEHAQFNHKLKIQSNYNDRLLNSNGAEFNLPYSEDWGLKQIKANTAWDLSTGNGVVVAIIDTGVDYNHPDLWNNIWVNPDTVSDRDHNGVINLDDLDTNHNHAIEYSELNVDVNADGVPDNVLGFDTSYFTDNDPMDYQGHGTHLAGIIAATGNNSIGLAGVAPKAKILALKAFADVPAFARESDLAAALLMALDIYSDHPEIKAMVTNNAWGSPGDYDALVVVRDAMKLAENGGLINFAAAGNEGLNIDDIKYFPASYTSTISVGSSAQNNVRSAFSSFGMSVDILAPGGGDSENNYSNNIVSTTNVNSYYARQSSDPLLAPDSNNTADYAYLRLSGTSQSTAYASGVAALILEDQSNLDLQTMRQIMLQSASPEASVLGGITNADAALKLGYVPPRATLEDLPLEGTANVKIYGTASANANANANGFGFSAYSIDYSLGINKPNAAVTWINLFNSSQAVNNALLYDMNTRAIANARVTVRLTTVDSAGHKSYDVKVININNPRFADLLVTTEFVNNKTDYSINDLVNFTIKVRNVRNEALGSINTAYGVQTTMTIPAGYSFDPILNPNSLCALSSASTLVCDWFTVQSGYLKTRSLVLKYIGANIDRSKQVTLGAAVIQAISQNASQKTVDPNALNNQSSPLKFWLKAYTDLALTLSTDKPNYRAGDQVLLKITASNNRLRPDSTIIASAFAVKTTIKLAPGLTPVTPIVDPLCSFDVTSSSLICNFQTVNSGYAKDKVIALRLASSISPRTAYNLITNAIVESNPDVLTQKTIEVNSTDNAVASLNVNIVR